jgi:hypothetical protein
VSRARQQRLCWQVAVLAALGALVAGFCLLPALRADETDGPATAGIEMPSTFSLDSNVPAPANSVARTASTASGGSGCGGCCGLSVTFNPDPIKTGFVKGIGGAADPPLLKHVIATVCPASARDQISIEKDDPREEIEIQNLKKKGNDQWEFDVAGKKKTEVENKDNPAKVVAQKANGGVAASAKAYVVVPTDYKHPNPESKDAVGSNTSLGRSTSPFFVAEGLPFLMELCTVYDADFTVNVLDQFGDALDDCYVGQEVFEKTAAVCDTNQKIVAGGSYNDRMGPNMPSRYMDSRDPGYTQALLTWMMSPCMAPTVGVNIDAGVEVQIAGHAIEKAKMTRLVDIVKDVLNPFKVTLRVHWDN